MTRTIFLLIVGFLIGRISKNPQRREAIETATDEECGYYPDSWNI